MDRRMPLVLALGLFAGVCGCSQTLPGLRTGPAAKPADEDITHKAPTYVAFGDFRARSALLPEQTDAQRQLFREQAKLSYLKAIEVDPKYLPAYVGLAAVQQASQEHAGAAAVYRKAIELNPQDGRLWFELGMCQCRAKDWTAALESMGKAIDLDPNNRQYAKTAGLAMARAGQWDNAFTLLARVDGEAKAHYDLARMMRHTNQPDLARRHAHAALAADPRFDAARTFLNEMSGAKADASVKTVSHTEPAPAAAPPAVKPESDLPRIITPSSQKAQPGTLPQTGLTTPAAEPKAGENKPAEETTDRPVRVPPLPVIKLPPRGA